ncbi:MAG: rhomboid family intramembrane serine protease [Desulfobacterales bacterium]|nr:rhomboid family intramembrane serine protease [Desulfobacterales bacterium]
MIVPITGQLSWRNPPIVTLALILANIVVFFGLQSKDQAYLQEAWQHYIESGLVRIELEYYLRSQGEDPAIIQTAEEEEDAETLNAYLEEMFADADFQRRLEQGEVVVPGDPDYAEWRRLRQECEAKKQRSSTYKWGFKAASWQPLSLLVYMFLHGGIGHLLGNMLFLWLFGCMLEPGMGRLRFLGLYLASGVGGGLFFALFNLQSQVPLVGASGAIAGLMGALPVLYGRRRVSFFCYFGFYFSVLRIPALALLPFWLGKEIWSEISSGDASSVAFLAHAGGIIAGAILAWIFRRFDGLADAAAFKTPPQDEISPLVEKAMQRLGELEFEQARDLFNQVLEQDPAHEIAITQLYNITKQQPTSPAFHQSAARYLDYLLHHPPAWDRIPGLYQEYLKLAGTPRLPLTIYPLLAGILADKGHPDAAGRIVTAVIKKQPLLDGLPAALLKLATAFQKKGQRRQADQCRRLLQTRYPESPEASAAKTANI